MSSPPSTGRAITEMISPARKLIVELADIMSVE
jgi:hypothetical protein